MFLKSIEMTGFKSFADKTLLSFEKGITSVVGPNGSGKSNISDAVRWVMGEMSAKALRGGNMQDVIFAGTEKRKPLGYAQVSLTLDNSDRIFNLDFDEITVSRKAYRSGESEYSINGAVCRLRDIHELFMDTGLGRDGYSIISQGKVGEIVSGRGEDRRNIIDEAAGISKYRHRREEAIRKLESTQENLVRISDIVGELESQIGPLSKQSEKAKKYLDLRESLKKIDINLFIRSVEKIKSELSETLKSFNIVTEELEDRQKEFEKTEKEIEEKNALADAKETELGEARDLLNECSLSIKELSGDIEVLKAAISSNGTMSESLLKDIGVLEDRKKQLEKSAADKEIEKNSALSELEGLKKELSDLSGVRDELSLEATKISDEINGLKTDIINKLNEIAGAKSSLASLEAFKSSFSERKETILRENEITASQMDETDKIIKTLKEASDAVKEKLDGDTKEYNLLSERIKKEEQSIRKNTDEKEELSSAYNKKHSRLNMLLEMEKDFEGFNRSVKTVLSKRASDLSECKIFGALSSVISVDKKYITAIETALGAAAQNIVVETEQDAKYIIEYLKENKAGRVTFLPVSSVKANVLQESEASKAPGFLGVASDIVSADKKFKNVIGNILGRCVVCDNIDNAILMSKKFSAKFKIVTLEGELINAGGAITGGYVNKSIGILSRAEEIKSLTAETRELEAKIKSSAQIISDAEERASAMKRRLEGIDSDIREREQELVKNEAQIAATEKMAEEKKQSIKSVNDELEMIEAQISDSNEQIAVLINNITGGELEIENINSKISDMESAFEKAKQKRDEASAKADAKNEEITSVLSNLSALKIQIDSIDSQTGEIDNDISAKREDIKSVDVNSEEKQRQIEEKQALIEEKNGLLENMGKNIDSLTAQRAAAKDDANALLTDSKDVRERIYTLKEEQTRIDVKRQKLESDQESITERMWNDYEITYITAVSYKEDIGSTTEAQKNAASLRAQIRALGNVNVDAIEEYKAVKERYDFLSAQYNDLTDAKAKLEKLIDSIQEKMKEQFEEQFKIINAHFDETFVQLFGGGRAKLILSDPSDLLQSGIDIEAQPPGKKLQNLSLLSGGEMAFTAIALLFAILKVRPTPFCILDEIEAALDEPNVYRFADYLTQYSKNTQFILITHRRGTMEAANLLYGVTMQEKGVSKLLALKIDEAESLG